VADRQGLTADDHLPDAGQHTGVGVDDDVEHRGGQERPGHTVPPEDLAEGGRGDRPVREEHQAAAVQQRTPDLGHRPVERRRAELQERLSRTQADVVDVEDQAQHGPLGHEHALRAAGRAGGVDDVGQVVGRHPRQAGGGIQVVGGQVGVVGRAVDQQHGRRAGRDAVGGGHAGYQDRRPDVDEQVPVPGGRVVGVQRHVGAARLEDAHERDDEVHTARQAHGDRNVRPDAKPAPTARSRMPSISATTAPWTSTMSASAHTTAVPRLVIRAWQYSGPSGARCRRSRRRPTGR
jgi:hypothetical protein